MTDQTTTAQTPIPSSIANRYQVEKILGQGGMAVVYQVLDTVTGKKVALKQLLEKESTKKNEEVARLFEYEYYALVQLAHPRVIEVYSYGTDDIRPYYTMELLDGGDLRELSPVPWKEACSLMIDVCSALGLLHSRRQVHRDLTPLNIRCTPNYRAKLIDFGAMVSMGPCKRVIGTPAFTAPEVISLQSLDARTDLYSLGASFYYIITAHHAYPARTFAELHEMWLSKPLPPSAFIQDIPDELDQLILSLMSVDPIARPINVAEVMERASAIAGIELGDQLIVSQAYLSAPTLVGRDKQIREVKERIAAAQRRHGGTIVVEGASGVGRSRMLDACVLEGKLSGATVLRADTSDAYVGHWGVVRALASQLIELVPDVALEEVKPYVSVLVHILPELFERFDDKLNPSSPPMPPRAQYPLTEDERPGFDPTAEVWAKGHSWRPSPPARKSTVPPQAFNYPQELRPRVHAALRDWLLTVSRRRALMVAVDDVHRVDEPSVAFIALLSHEISKEKLILAVTCLTDASTTSPAAIKLLKEAGHRVELRNLNIEQTEELLGSVFGEAPNVRLLTDRLQAVSQGNPSAVMQLTQHLVDKAVIRYQAGTWTLPNTIDTGDLPSGMVDALKARARTLESEALALAQTMALSPEQSFSYEECLLLTEHQDRSRLVKNLDDLVVSEILSTDGQYYSFRQQGWVSALIGDIDKQREVALHHRIAAMFERRGNEPVRAARHLINAGEEERALNVFVDDFERNNPNRLQNSEIVLEYLQLLPSDWINTLESLLAICEKLARPRKHAHYLHSNIVSLSAVTALADRTHYLKVIEQLYRDSGLDCYYELGDLVEPSGRLWRALELAQQRYDSSSESERVLAPADAVRGLAEAIIAAISYVASSFDYSLIRGIPSLAPLIPLSVALDIIDRNVYSTTDVITGRTDRARRGYLEILERMAQPDHGGIDEIYYENTRLTIMFAVALIDASLGRNTALRWNEEFNALPLFAVNGWRIQMIYHLRQGDKKKAIECKERLELLQIQNSPSQFFEGTHYYTEGLAYASSDDLVGIKESIDGIQNMARRFDGWLPVLHYARGEYQRIRGDYANALVELDQALKCTGPGLHAVWPYTAGCYIVTLFELERFQEAQELGRKFLKAAEDENLDIVVNFIRRALALPEAKLGGYERAVGLLDLAIEQFNAAEITGLNLGLLYETRARVAIFANDRETFQRYAKLCAEQYKTGHNPALAAKYEKLMQEAMVKKIGVTDELARAAELTDMRGRTNVNAVASIIGDCKDSRERAERVLALLVEKSNTTGGLLYTMRKEGPALLAQRGPIAPSIELSLLVRDRLSAELNDDIDITTGASDTEGTSDESLDWSGKQGEKYCPVILGHRTREGVAITGLAVLLIDPSKQFVFPVDEVPAISKALLDVGDVPKLLSLMSVAGEFE